MTDIFSISYFVKSLLSGREPAGKFRHSLIDINRRPSYNEAVQFDELVYLFR